MPLRAILILGDDEDVEALSEAVNAEPCEFPDYEDVLGVKWHYKSSLVINLITLRECAEEEAEEYGGDGCCCPILREEFLVTLLHELRHLGADNRDFLPDALAQTMSGAEDAVEAWAREIASQ